MNAIYWCEFPEECDWAKLASWVGKQRIIVYVACTSLKHYKSICKLVKKYSSQIYIYAWPVLSKAEGYWFSGFTSRKCIDSLEKYRGISIKLDLEPPFPKYFTFWSGMKWLFQSFLRPASNAAYLQEKISSLSRNTPLIVSTFPLPLFMLRKWGWITRKNIQHNFMYYRTLVPPWLQWSYNRYYLWFIHRHPGSYFAVGLVSPGIFGNEPVYTHLSELERDIKFLKKHGVTNFAFFELSGMVKRRKEWFDATRNL